MSDLDPNIFRLSVFVSINLIMCAWEFKQPYRTLSNTRFKRYFGNFSLVFLNTFTLQLVSWLAAPIVAIWAAKNGVGLFNWIDMIPALELFLVLLLFDFVIYWQHRIFHIHPFFWRFHAVHHSDKDLDFSSAGRFHIVEIVLSLLIKCVFVLAIGPSFWAIVVFETLLNASATFNHANIKLPDSISKRLEKFIVTPKMHRIHHSVVRDESNTNFGFCFSFWDRLFGSYTLKTQEGDDLVVIGLKETETENSSAPIWMLKSPFTNIYNDKSTEQK